MACDDLITLTMRVDQTGWKFQDMGRIRKALNRAGYDADPISIKIAYEEYGEEYYCAGWPSFDSSSDDDLDEVAEKILPYLVRVADAWDNA